MWCDLFYRSEKWDREKNYLPWFHKGSSFFQNLFKFSPSLFHQPQAYPCCPQKQQAWAHLHWLYPLHRTLEKSGSVSHWIRPTLCNSMDYSLPGFSVHGIPQQEYWRVAILFSRGSSWPRDRTHVSHLAGRFFTAEPPGKPFPWLTYFQFWGVRRTEEWEWSLGPVTETL